MAALSHRARRLHQHLTAMAINGVCELSVRELAKGSAMSVGLISEAQRELVLAGVVRLMPHPTHPQRRIISLMGQSAAVQSAWSSDTESAALQCASASMPNEDGGGTVHTVQTVHTVHAVQTVHASVQSSSVLSEIKSDDDEARARFLKLSKQLAAHGVRNTGNAKTLDLLARRWAVRDDAEQQIAAVFADVKARAEANPRRFYSPLGYCIRVLFDMAATGAIFTPEMAFVGQPKPKTEQPRSRQQGGKRGNTYRLQPVIYTDEMRAAAEQRARAEMEEDQ